mgnify:CR=1 FL=1
MNWIMRAAPAALLAAALPVAAQAQDATPTEAIDPAELAEARSIIEVMFPTAERDETFGNLIAQFSSQFRQAIPKDAMSDPGLQAILDGYLDGLPERLMPLVKTHLPKILDATAVAYTHEFSLDELQDIHAFAQTDAGRHYLTKSASLVGDPAVAAANTAYLAELQKLQAGMQQELGADIIAYLEANPEIAEKLRQEQ